MTDLSDITAEDVRRYLHSEGWSPSRKDLWIDPRVGHIDLRGVVERDLKDIARYEQRTPAALAADVRRLRDEARATPAGDPARLVPAATRAGDSATGGAMSVAPRRDGGAVTEVYYDAVRLIARLTDELHSATLGADSVRGEHWQWMSREPEPGDLVVEQSSAWRGVDALDRIGRFLGRDDDGERAYVIALADGRVMSWVNCRFARVPEERLGMLTGTAFWIGGTAGEVSGTGKNVRDYCRERYGVEMEPDGGHTTLRGEPYWRWPRDARGKPVRRGEP